MGYLDGSTITVDAILTKKGRQILSGGGSLNVSSFTLSDTGVDYTLWNVDHPSGSAYYGEAIENLPQVEALTAAQYQLRNKLVTFGKDTTSMPVAYLNNDTHTFDTALQWSSIVNITGFAGGQSGFQLLIPDISICTCTSANGQVVTGNALMFIPEQQIPNALLYELTTTGGTTGYQFDIKPNESLAATTTMTLTYIHIATGAWTSAQVTVNNDVGGRAGKTMSKGRG